MARPATLCRLKKGTFIDDNLGFVETFNYLVDFIDNLKGDGDLDVGRPVKLDRSKDDRPVIRFNTNARGAGGGGGGKEYIAGDDTNIVFTDIESGPNIGKTSIDVYYI